MWHVDFEKNKHVTENILLITNSPFSFTDVHQMMVKMEADGAVVGSQHDGGSTSNGDRESSSLKAIISIDDVLRKINSKDSEYSSIDTLVPQTYTCELCHQEFLNSSELDSHVLTHASRMVHQCCVCQAIFPLKQDGETHVLIHIKKRFTCLACGQVYDRQAILDRHMIAEGHKQFNLLYTCDGNQQEYMTLSSLKEYLLSCMSEVQQYNCAFCDKQYRTASEFTLHYKEHTEANTAGRLQY